MVTVKTLKLTNLQINTDNYRFDKVSSQKEAIDQMVNDQGTKLFNLAQHIIENGLNPNDKIQVTPLEENATNYNVLEGNRRITSLKLLNNPDLIEHDDSLKTKFKKLNNENKSNILEEVECTVYENPLDAEVWIGIKHGSGTTGIETIKWTPLQKLKYEERIGKKAKITLQVITKLETSTEVPEDIKSNLVNLDITNLDRLISDPDVRKFLGIEINNGIVESEIEEKEVIKGLIQITKDLLEEKINVNNIRNKDNRKQYIKDFPEESKPQVNKKASSPWQFNGVTASKIVTKKIRRKPNPKNRKKLIPKTCVLKIKNPKVNSIYYELQDLNLDKFTNAIAISLRIFVELSLDLYIQHNKLTNVTIDSGLQHKVNEVSIHIEKNNPADKQICKGIRVETQNEDGLLGIKTLHAYIHNFTFLPSKTELITTWDRIEAFIVKIWENIK